MLANGNYSATSQADGHGVDYDSSRSYFDLNELPHSPPPPSSTVRGTGEVGFRNSSPEMRGTVQPARNRCRTPLRILDDSYLEDESDELEEDYDPSMYTHPKEILAASLKLRNVEGKKNTCFDQYRSTIQESVTIQCHQRHEKSVQMEQLRNKSAELKLKLAAVEAEYEKIERIQQKLDAPVNEEWEKLNKKLEAHKQNLKGWKKSEKNMIDKLKNAMKEKGNVVTLLDRLGICLIKEPLTEVTEGEVVMCFKGMTFTKIDPANPDTEYTVYFENFDDDNWTFKVTSARPTFEGFDELAKKMNEDGKLDSFIFGCRKNWCPVLPLLSNSPGSTGSSEQFDNEEEQEIKNL